MRDRKKDRRSHQLYDLDLNVELILDKEEFAQRIFLNDQFLISLQEKIQEFGTDFHLTDNSDLYNSKRASVVIVYSNCKT